MVKIFVSTGHSRSDPGAVANGTTEYKELRKFLPEAVELARPYLALGDSIVVVPPVYGYIEAVQYFLKHADRSTDIFTEVHLNSNSGAPGTGTETWYGGLKVFAKNINSSFVRGMRRQYEDWTNRGLKYGQQFYITRKLSGDGNILELGFLNNKTDLARLRQQASRALAEAFISVSHGEPRALPEQSVEPEPEPEPKPDPEPKRDGVRVDGVEFNRFKSPVRVVTVKEKTPLWNFNTASWGGFEEVDRFSKGYELTVVGEAHHQLGGIYLMTDFSFGSADETGRPHKPWGVNAADLKRVGRNDEPETGPGDTPENENDTDEGDDSKDRLEPEKLPEPGTVRLRRDAHTVYPGKDFESARHIKAGSKFRKFAALETDRKYYVTESEYKNWKDGEDWTAIEADALEFPQADGDGGGDAVLDEIRDLLGKILGVLKSVLGKVKG